MRCNDCDAHMDEMLSGIFHPDANQHMRQCERCASHFRARATVQNNLRNLVSASASGPSPATDRAVMESYRRLQQRRAAAWNSEPASDSASKHTVSKYAAKTAVDASAASTARLFAFPSRGFAPVWGSRTWWTGAAAAAVVFAVFGSAVHLWTGVPSVSAPGIATAPSVSAPQQSASIGTSHSTIVARSAQVPAKLSSQSRVLQSKVSHSEASQSSASRSEVASAGVRSTTGGPVLTATAPRPPIAFGDGANYNSAPMTQLAPGVSSVIHLASSGAANSVAQSASSTWPGYSNLMYCDPVVCSGPMQVVHIKVPVGQVKPNLGQTVGNAFVNAEVVIGPDGVARAIRVAN